MILRSNIFLGNVLFACSEQNWSFTLRQFAQIYLGDRTRKMNNVKPDDFAKRLWGDLYYDASTRKFSKQASDAKNQRRSFVEFVLEPLYKLYSQVLGESSEVLTHTLKSLNIKMTKEELRYYLQYNIFFFLPFVLPTFSNFCSY